MPPCLEPSCLIFKSVRFHAVDVEGTKIFYREAGDPTRPTLILLHGLLTASRLPGAG